MNIEYTIIVLYGTEPTGGRWENRRVVRITTHVMMMVVLAVAVGR